MNQEYLKSILVYNPKFGIFYWKKNQGTAKAGNIAGSDSHGYIRIGINGKGYLAHRLAWLYIYGYTPKMLDHINRDRSDNRIQNLRLCTYSENLRNCRYKNRGQSKLRGVGWHKKSGKWVARIRDGVRQIHLGLFTTEIDAAKCYDENARKIHGSFATVNFN